MMEFSKLLLKWYDQNGRELPWRTKNGMYVDPYHVWLSEIMLQQTTVATVKSYFNKFITLWPSVEALATAPREDVLKEWAGLGYYARARNLHKCANELVTMHGGKFPTTEAELKALPGIGDYTSAAITAIAFNRHAAVVDGNIERIITRVQRITEPLPSARKSIKTAMANLTPTDRPGDFAQAMMDLGASQCSPKKPECAACPVSTKCQATQKGDMERYPVKAPKKTKPTRRAVSFWLECDGHLLLERRPEKGLLGGMPGLFSTPWIVREAHPLTAEYSPYAPVSEKWQEIEGTTKHTFTHFHLETKLVRANTPSLHNIEDGFWHPISRLSEVGLPTVFKKITSLMDA